MKTAFHMKYIYTASMSFDPNRRFSQCGMCVYEYIYCVRVKWSHKNACVQLKRICLLIIFERMSNMLSIQRKQNIMKKEMGKTSTKKRKNEDRESQMNKRQADINSIHSNDFFRHDCQLYRPFSAQSAHKPI